MDPKGAHFLFALMSFMMSIGCLSEPLYYDGRPSIFMEMSIYLMYVPSLMSPVGLQNLGQATEAFLESKFESLAGQIDNITVIVSSQSLDGRKALVDNLTNFVVQADLQVLVHSEGIESSQLIENKVREYFNEDWSELRAVLTLVDSQFFGYLKYIELLPETKDYFSTSDSIQESEIHRGIPLKVKIIYLTLGVGIVLGVLALVISCCISQLRSKRVSDRGTATSSFASRDSGIIERTNTFKKECKSQIQTSALKSHPKSPCDQTSKKPNELLQSDDELRTGQVQRVFSKDKVECAIVASHLRSSPFRSLSIEDLRDEKNSAEECFRESLKEILRPNFSEVDLQSMGIGRKYSTVQRFLTPLIVLGSSDHNFLRGQAQQQQAGKMSSHRDDHKKNEREGHNPNNLSAGCHKSTEAEPKKAVINKLPSRSVVSSSSEDFLCIVAHTNHHDECSVSTVTRSSCAISAESIDIRLDDFIRSKKTSATSRRATDDASTADSTISYYIGSDADDFGSVAHSLPSGGQTEQLEYLEELV